MKTDIAPTAVVSHAARIEGRGAVNIEDYATIEDQVCLGLGGAGTGKIRIGYRSRIKYGAVLRSYGGFIDIGDRVSIGEYSVLTGHGGLTIGNGVIVAGHCYITGAEHITSGSAMIRFQGERARGICLGDGVWIGAHVTILDGVEIGANSVIGAGSVVTRSLPEEMICFGSPCRAIRTRHVSQP
jgi:acetyltransferase-like isoleucine patch superfamily enzyme